MAARVALVTGATDGLGLGVAERLVADGWDVHLHGRSAERLAATAEELGATFANELASRLDPAEVTANSLHPSTFMPTKMVLEDVGRSVDSLEDGVAATVRLAAEAELEGVSGRFFDRQAEADPHPQAEDPEARRRLRELTLELTGEPEPAGPLGQRS